MLFYALYRLVILEFFLKNRRVILHILKKFHVKYINNYTQVFSNENASTFWFGVCVCSWWRRLNRWSSVPSGPCLWEVSIIDDWLVSLPPTSFISYVFIVFEFYIYIHTIHTPTHTQFGLERKDDIMGTIRNTCYHGDEKHMQSLYSLMNDGSLSSTTFWI